MKKTITLLLLLLTIFQHAWATKRFVDPNVMPNTVSNTYATFQAAWYSTVNGDTLLLRPGTYNIGTLSIDRGVTIQPDTLYGFVTLTGGIAILFSNNIKVNVFNISLSGNVDINGLNASNGNITLIGISCNSILFNSGSTINNPSKINIIDCSINGSVNCIYAGYLINMFNSNVLNDIKAFHIKMFASKTNNLYINSEIGQQNDSVNKNLIIADTITGYFDYRCEDRQFVIANNLINELAIYSWNYFYENRVWNNEFYNNSRFSFAITGVPKFNLDISNNISFSLPSSTYLIGCGNCWSPGPVYNYINWGGNYKNISGNCAYGYPGYGCGFSLGLNWNSNFSSWPFVGQMTNTPGVFKWTYNGDALGNGNGGGSYPITNIAGTTNIVDAGNPDPKYMDIDMTVNDRGRLGGSYSILNYNPTVNPSNGKAYIYDIELPEIISSPTQPIQIKAKGYHRN